LLPIGWRGEEQCRLFYEYDPDEDLLQFDCFCRLDKIDIGHILSPSERDALLACQNIEPSPTRCLGDARRVPSSSKTRMITLYEAPVLVVVKSIKFTPREAAEFRRLIHEDHNGE
jgi:hypothetical protein